MEIYLNYWFSCGNGSYLNRVESGGIPDCCPPKAKVVSSNLAGCASFLIHPRGPCTFRPAISFQPRSSRRRASAAFSGEISLRTVSMKAAAENGLASMGAEAKAFGNPSRP
jgi:hypothetical protein